MPQWKSLRNILTRTPQWKSTGSTGCSPTPSSSAFCSLQRAKKENIICIASPIFVTIFLSWMFMKCLWDMHMHIYICCTRTYSEFSWMFMKCFWLHIHIHTSSNTKCSWYHTNVYNILDTNVCETFTYIRPAIRAMSNGLSPWTQPVQFNPSTSCKEMFTKMFDILFNNSKSYNGSQNVLGK